MDLRLEQPWWLAIFALAAIPALFAARQTFPAMSSVRRWSAIVARIVLASLLALALAGLTAIRRTERLSVVAVIDVSESVRRFVPQVDSESGARSDPLTRVRAFLRAAAAARRPDDQLGLVVFDGRAAVVATPTAVDVLDRPFEPPGGAAGSGSEGTDLAGAIRLAAALFPPDATRRMVLFSDGNETTGDALAAARELTGGGAPAASEAIGTPIDIVPLAFARRDSVIIEGLDAPSQAPAGSVIRLRVALQASDPVRGRLSVLYNGEPILNPGGDGLGPRNIELRRGLNIQAVDARLGPGRVHRFEAVFEPEGAYANLSPAAALRSEAFTVTPGGGAVLIVDGVHGQAAPGAEAASPLARLLAAQGMDVVVRPFTGVPPDLVGLQAYDLVILDNVPADAFGRQTHGAIASYVTDLGGGLVMLGGPDSFGAGAWKGTDIEPILPVRLDLPEKLVVSAAAVVFVLDNSGSMARGVMGSSRSQQQIANEGAAMALRTLDKNDLVGVYAFNSGSEEVVPLHKNTDPDRTADAVRGIAPGGGTNMPPALSDARAALARVDAQIKHVVVLSDGQSHGRDELPAIVAGMRAEGITVSAIAVGDGADLPAMQRIARDGGGEFFQVTDPNVLPRVFLKAVRVVRTPMVRLAPFDPVLIPGASSVVEGIGAVPRLTGVNLTQARRDPGIALSMLTPQGEPLLASWNVGLGRVAAFTSDAERWASPWLEWEGYGRLWTQIARSVARPGIGRTLDMTSSIVGNVLRIRAEAVQEDGRPIDLLNVPVTVFGPTGKRIESRLVQVGPGQYTGSVPAEDSGAYVVTAAPRAGATRLAPAIAGAVRPPGGELRALRSNVGLLASIARATGGRLLDIDNPPERGIFDPSFARPVEARSPLWPSLLVASVCVLLLDVGTRRIAWDRLIAREFRSEAERSVLASLRERGAETVGRLASLRGKRGAAGSAPPGGGAAMLGEADARQIAREHQSLRRAARAAGGARAPEAPLSVAPSSSEKTQPERTGAPDNDQSPLMAAKRRARDRMDCGE
ncbi:MAG: VWA domain-containing protein [Phycisphaerae bacterium]|nr:VWA domain-containing protein [Phycisphaerae bacterium]